MRTEKIIRDPQTGEILECEIYHNGKLSMVVDGKMYRQYHTAHTEGPDFTREWMEMRK